MNRRKIAIQTIICDAAENGIVGKIGIRAYIEARLSKSAFIEAARIGQRIYERKMLNATGENII